MDGLFASPVALYVALGLGFAGLAVLLYLLLAPSGDARVSRALRRGLSTYERGPESTMRPGSSSRVTASSLTRSAVQLASRVPRPTGYDERVQMRLDRAGWPLRAEEFLAIRVAAVLVGLLVVWALLGNLVLALLLAVVLAVLPPVVLDNRVRARQARFLQQLPDTLQLISGALKAGYGVLQAIDAVVRESPEPTASEFSRVLTESRLGLALEDSLESMAERVGSEDFRWVVVAINIQRRVGGNLAELLDTVSATLREREMVRRQITSLSAEGRMSAMVLGAMPVVIGLYLFTVNPEYLGLLLERPIGNLMAVGAVALMGVGALWMRRLIDIDV